MTTVSVAPVRELTETEAEALRNIAEGSESAEAEPPEPEEFSYCVGRPWPASYANPGGTGICVYAYGSQVHDGTMDEAEGLRQYVDEKTGEKNQIYRLVPITSTNDKGEVVELVTAEKILRALVETLEVNVPDYGLFKGKGKKVLWQTFSLNSKERIPLCIEANDYQDASLNHIWVLLNQARQTLGIPETLPPSTKAS